MTATSGAMRGAWGTLAVLGMACALAACTRHGDGAGQPTPATPSATATADVPSATGPAVECRVPEVTGQAYDRARPALLAAGWQPVAQTGPSPSLDAVRQRGMTEIEACAGTAAGECLMHFRNAQGDTLDVVTVGGVPGDGAAATPTVHELRPTCRA